MGVEQLRRLKNLQVIDPAKAPYSPRSLKTTFCHARDSLLQPSQNTAQCVTEIPRISAVDQSRLTGEHERQASCIVKSGQRSDLTCGVLSPCSGGAGGNQRAQPNPTQHIRQPGTTSMRHRQAADIKNNGSCGNASDQPKGAKIESCHPSCTPKRPSPARRASSGCSAIC